MAEQRPIPTPGDGDLEQLTQLRVRATQRVEYHRRIVDDTSQLLHEAQMIILEFHDPYHPTARDLLWDVEARMEVLLHEFLALWAEEIEDRASEHQIWRRPSW